VFEDAPAGVAAGRAAGATVVALTTSHAPAQLRAAGPPAAMIPDFAETHVVAEDDGFILEIP